MYFITMDDGSILMIKYNVKTSTLFNDIFNIQLNIKMYLN